MLAELSALLNFVIVMAFVFLVISLIASVMVEAASNVLRLRATMLRARLEHALSDAGFAAQVLDGPLLRALSAARRLPSYIPPDSFAQAVIARALDGAEVRLARLPAVLRDLAAVEGIGEGEVDRLRVQITRWYDTVTERLTGEYTRRARFMLFVAGLVLAVAFNINAIAIAGAVWGQRPYLEASVAQIDAFYADLKATTGDTALDAAVLARDPALLAQAVRIVQTQQALRPLAIPLGWVGDPAARTQPTPGGWHLLGTAGVLTLAGWLLTALSVVPGAKLWYDLLGRALSIRASLRPAVPLPKPPPTGAAGPG